MTSKLVKKDEIEVKEKKDETKASKALSDEVESFEGDGFLCFSEAIHLVMEGVPMKRKVWSDDKRLVYRNGKFCIISDKRGIDTITHFNIELALDNYWVKFDPGSK